MELAISVPKEVMLMARWISDFKLDLLAGGFLHLVLIYVKGETFQHTNQAELAQSVERTTLNRVVEGSIPSFGVAFLLPPSTFLLTMGCLLVQSANLELQTTSIC